MQRVVSISEGTSETVYRACAARIHKIKSTLNLEIYWIPLQVTGFGGKNLELKKTLACVKFHFDVLFNGFEVLRDWLKEKFGRLV